MKSKKILKPFPVQIGQSARADFDESTWEFEMPEDFLFTGGRFAIVPEDQINALQSSLSEAKELLREIVNQMENEHISEEYGIPVIEKAKSFLNKHK